MDFDCRLNWFWLLLAPLPWGVFPGFDKGGKAARRRFYFGGGPWN